MAVTKPEHGGVAEVDESIAAGRAVVVPFPSPLPYALAGRTRAAVNSAKNRPTHQPTGILLVDLNAIRSHLALSRRGQRVAKWTGRVELANLLLPLTLDAPPWLALCANDEGWLGISLACLPVLRPIVERYGHLHISSANRTGLPGATTARAADSMFGSTLLVLDGDHFRRPATRHGSAAIVQIASDDTLSLRRAGIQNQLSGLSDADYLTRIAATAC